MKRNEILLEVPTIGEVLLEPFTYNNGREGYMCIVESNDSTRSFNLTINPLNLDYDKEHDFSEMYLKLWGDAEIVSRHILTKTDMFDKSSYYTCGINYAQFATLNSEYYEKED